MIQHYTLIDFSDADSSEWRVINDGVMGGLSRSTIRRTAQNTGVFAGELSLENNGGFASARATLPPHDLSEFAGLQIRIRGDGRTYQLRLRADDRFDGVAYRAQFETSADEWITVQIAFDQFLPTYRGRILNDVPPLDTSRIQQVGFLLADKKQGSFKLEIEYIRIWKPEGSTPR